MPRGWVEHEDNTAQRAAPPVGAPASAAAAPGNADLHQGNIKQLAPGGTLGHTEAPAQAVWCCWHLPPAFRSGELLPLPGNGSATTVGGVAPAIHMQRRAPPQSMPH